jgi:hypothetical protein
MEGLITGPKTKGKDENRGKLGKKQKALKIKYLLNFWQYGRALVSRYFYGFLGFFTLKFRQSSPKTLSLFRFRRFWLY